jgi:hypothetical protein
LRFDKEEVKILVRTPLAILELGSNLRVVLNPELEPAEVVAIVVDLANTDWAPVCTGAVRDDLPVV